MKDEVDFTDEESDEFLKLFEEAIKAYEVTFERGEFVRYTLKNELGLVGAIRDDDTVYCWFHRGGTVAATPIHLIEHLTKQQVFSEKFSNEYAKLSLLERQRRLFEGGDVSDLIDI